MCVCVQRMEPQLYKLLEVSWEAWQDSGIDVRSLRDSDRVGVYCGAVGSEVAVSFPQQLLQQSSNQQKHALSWFTLSTGAWRMAQHSQRDHRSVYDWRKRVSASQAVSFPHLTCDDPSCPSLQAMNRPGV